MSSSGLSDDRLPGDATESVGKDEGTSSPGLTYEDLTDLLERVYDDPYRDSWGNQLGDQIEAARWPDETRGEVKRRLMRGVYEADLRAKYHKAPRGFVQIDGKPYSTHDPFHFVNRYGMGGSVRAQEIRLGVFKATPEAMMRHEAAENGARLTLRLLSPIVAGAKLEETERSTARGGKPVAQSGMGIGVGGTDPNTEVGVPGAGEGETSTPEGEEVLPPATPEESQTP